MLDDREFDRRPLSLPERHAVDPLPAATLAEAWRDLFARLTGRGRAAPSAVPAEPDAAARRAGDPTGLRAEARAAFRSVEGAPEAALEAALTVMEARILALRDATQAYGEALKTIQIYSADEASRVAARGALRAVPEQLAAAAPVPHLSNGGRRHG